ncbi:hypothetical protein U8527_07170 [Kordia algicida OT-1]|uniref:Uncharacterized protein n=1 Tax=Kordia algicida OT-1 TaxID=391587 RepID=A9EA12_9FLAO|nr:hypothetical protein [Kordia algicida]EDP94725.1 hypothetical protein KAOT1_00575 [Kordia algicida OT-1]
MNEAQKWEDERRKARDSQKYYPDKAPKEIDKKTKKENNTQH